MCNLCQQSTALREEVVQANNMALIVRLLSTIARLAGDVATNDPLRGFAPFHVLIGSTPKEDDIHCEDPNAPIQAFEYIYNEVRTEILQEV